MLENGKILVKVELVDDTTSSGIIISTAAKAKNTVTVIDVGYWYVSYGQKLKTGIEKGDKLLLDPRARQIPYKEDQGLFIVDIDDVLMKETE